MSQEMPFFRVTTARGPMKRFSTTHIQRYVSIDVYSSALYNLDIGGVVKNTKTVRNLKIIDTPG
jgi:hypothetical protein